MKKEDILWCDINYHQSNSCLPEEVWSYCKEVRMELFEISNYGRCRLVSGNKTKVYKITDNGKGYKKVAVQLNGKVTNRYIHRLVAQAFLDNPDELPQVNHKPSGLGKFDNRVEHLEWCTAKQNIQDAHLNGQMDNRTVHKTKIDKKSDSFIKDMYTHYKNTGMVGETAKLFGVPRTTLSSIVNKRSRVNITDEIDKLYK